MFSEALLFLKKKKKERKTHIKYKAQFGSLCICSPSTVLDFPACVLQTKAILKGETKSPFIKVACTQV